MLNDPDLRPKYKPFCLSLSFLGFLYPKPDKNCPRQEKDDLTEQRDEMELWLELTTLFSKNVTTEHVTIL